MDFTFSEEQEAVRETAAAIFEGRATTERVKAIETSDDRVDGDLWAELAKANLLGVALPEDVGGSGAALIRDERQEGAQGSEHELNLGKEVGHGRS